MTPQQKRVLAASRSFKGTCSADWIEGLGLDGLGKISRVPARIEELEDKYGCVFEIIGWRNKTRVFRLISGPDVDSDSTEHSRAVPSGMVAPAVAVSGRLFEVGPSQSGHYDPRAA